jgi:hypothetical protein
MDDTQQQLWTYLNWLQDCGQVFSVPRDSLPEAGVVLRKDETPQKVWDLAFISPERLNADEETMVKRIAAALGFAEDSFTIVSKWIDGAQLVAVFLGDGPEDGRNSLAIPHPGAMLRDPSLKRQAWDRLQGIKRSGASPS